MYWDVRLYIHKLLCFQQLNNVINLVVIFHTDIAVALQTSVLVFTDFN